MTNTDDRGAALCAIYNTLTNGVARPVIYERLCWEFFQAGFTPDDFELTLKHVLWSNKTKDFKYSLDLRTLLSNLERFNDLLSQATQAKARKQAPQAKVLSEFRRWTPEDTRVSAKNVNEILKGLQS